MKLKWKHQSKLIKFIVYFDCSCIIKHIFFNTIFSKNASLLQKFKNKILSCTFPMKTIPQGAVPYSHVDESRVIEEQGNSSQPMK